MTLGNYIRGSRSRFEGDYTADPDAAISRLLMDPVTGLPKGTYRVDILRDVIDWVSEDDDNSAWYVEIDLRNLGGANAVFGHSRTNEIYLRYVANLLQERFQETFPGPSSWHFAFRHGGDELSIIACARDTSDPSIEVLMADIATEIAEHFAELELIPHPKSPHRFSTWGLGIAYGISEITADKEFGQVFTEADTRTEAVKRGEDQPPKRQSWRQWWQKLCILARYLWNRKMPEFPKWPTT